MQRLLLLHLRLRLHRDRATWIACLRSAQWPRSIHRARCAPRASLLPAVRDATLSVCGRLSICSRSRVVACHCEWAATVLRLLLPLLWPPLATPTASKPRTTAGLKSSQRASNQIERARDASQAHGWT